MIINTSRVINRPVTAANSDALLDSVVYALFFIVEVLFGTGCANEIQCLMHFMGYVFR